jgi:hypothetical protein
MPLPELLDELFRLYRNHFSLIVAVSLIVVLPSLVWTLITGTYKLSFGSYANLFSTSGSSGIPTFSSTELQRLIGLLLLGLLGSVILLPFSLGAVYRAVTDVSLGRPVSIGGVLRETLAKYLPLLGLIVIGIVLAIIWFFLFALGLVLLILPGLGVLALGLFFAVRWSLAVAAMMAEDVGPITALRRSWNLVSGMWWRTFGILLVLTIMQAVIGGALGFLFGLIVGVILSGDLLLAVGATGSTLLNAVVSPIVTIGIVLLYFDLRVRKEGLDLDQLARQTTPGPAPA